ncbi:MAG TPA: VWA domain-containing protein [Thermoanaerobaculia bacterium]
MKGFPLALIALLTISPAVAQQPPAPAPAKAPAYLETFEVRIHNLDVVVTDAKGKPVSGLTKDDFIVTENGTPQSVTNFSAFGASEGVANTGDQPPPKKVVFFIDEMSLHPSSRSKLLKNAMSMLDAVAQPGDQVMVATPFRTPKIVQTFTSDKEAMRKGLQEAMESSQSRLNTQAANELRFLNTQLSMITGKGENDYELRRQVRRIFTDHTRRRVEQRLGELYSFVGTLGAMEGKRIIVLVTSSLSATPGLEAWADERSKNAKLVARTASGGQTKETEKTVIFEEAEALPMPFEGAGVVDTNVDYVDLRPDILALGRRAAANGVTIYSLFPDMHIDANIEANVDRRASATGQPLSQAIFPAMIENTQRTISILAQTTGGATFRGDGNIDDAFRTISTDVQNYYSLGYRASGSEGAPRAVTVSVKGRNDLKVRTRSDVVGNSYDASLSDLVVANLVVPNPVNELWIAAEAGTVAREARNTVVIPLTVHVPMQRLTFLPDGDVWRAKFSVHYAASGEKTDFWSGHDREQTIELTRDEYEFRNSRVFTYGSRLRVSPGKYRLAVGVMDETSRQTGFQTIEVAAQ